MKPSFLKSVSFAVNGLTLAWHEKHFKIHLVAAVLCITFGFLLKITITEWCLVLMCIGIVLALETINTAIEYFVNFVEPNHHPVAGKIKDLAAGAVLIFSIFSAVVGLLIFGKYILALLYSN